MSPKSVTIYSTEKYLLDWPGHVFPTGKYRAVRERLLRLRPGLAPRFREPSPAREDQILLAHTGDFLRRVEALSETPDLAILEFEIPVSKAVLDALRLHTGGSILACRDAMETGAAAVNLGGGFHHAFADHGEGFCVFNDVAVALLTARREGWLRTAAVIDCDVHQGNGTARIFRDDPSVYTFSIHQENNYPIKQGSDWDIGLEDFAGDDRYLAALGEALPVILKTQEPDLVFYVAGADPFEEDLLGGLKLTKEGFRERDRLVFGLCRDRGIPVAAALAGGYARRPEDVVEIHTNMVLDLLDVMEPGVFRS